MPCAVVVGRLPGWRRLAPSMTNGIHGTGEVVFMNRVDIDRLGLAPGVTVTLRTASKDNI
jgi:hypothetical protein